MISLKSDFTKALEQCIVNCSSFVAEHKNSIEMKHCVDLAQELIQECGECLAACETARPDRGGMMHNCAEACKNCISAFPNHKVESGKNCMNSINKLMEELSYLMA